jgi:hypothetical protein
MKVLFYILFITVFQKSIAQNYIERGGDGCGIMAETAKYVLLENGKSYTCHYSLRDSQSVKDSCSTSFILAQLQKNAPKKITKVRAAKISEIFILAKQITALPGLDFSPKYCDISYEVNIESKKQQFNSQSGTSKKEKELITKFIRFLNFK